MVTQQSIEAQLRKIGFNERAWGRQEIKELPNVILPDEEIFECVNGVYEGGFALLVATDVRVLLIDKKPFNYLTVEDLRFDMINEIDYNHRAFGAYVDITTGNRELKFRSYNRDRLRKLISHVQHRMADIKRRQANHQEGQNQHLEQINTHLRAYLMAQYKHQQELERSMEEAKKHGRPVERPEPPKPSPELSDYLLAQGLMERHQAEVEEAAADAGGLSDDLYAAGVREVFGDRVPAPPEGVIEDMPNLPPPAQPDESRAKTDTMDLNPMRIAYSKLPMALRNRKFGRPSFHAHSAHVQPEPAAEPQPG